ncbi:hypothetical protein GGI21_003720, partial [Coemansia aciculifera]
MLDQFTIATKGGVVLWSKAYAPITNRPVDLLVQDVLIQSTRLDTGGGSNKYHTGTYSLQWTFANELNIMFIAVYQKILQLPYLEDLLYHVKKHFVTRFQQEIKSLVDSESTRFPDFGDFEQEFEQVWRAVEDRASKERAAGKSGGGGGGVPRKFEDTKKFQSTAKGAKLELEELAQASEMNL